MDAHIVMSRKEARYAEILPKIQAGKLKNQEAAELLHITSRHLRRLKRIFRNGGIEGLVHKSRGKKGNRKLPEEERTRIVLILKEQYPDFGPTFASEKLREKHAIDRDPKTVRAIMIEEGLFKPKRRKKEAYRSWRERRANPGEMEQYDGSYEHWFEERGEKCCLLAAIDDATSIVTQAKFDRHEGVEPTFRFWQEYVENRGKPLSIYVDKFSTYSMNHALAKENPDTLTQFARAMKELGIEVITAHSSQAKGRVERLFKTLQDRLVKELRLSNISTAPEANVFLKEVFLPDFNRRFSVEPKTSADLHRPLSEKETGLLPAIFSRQDERIVRKDFTIAYKKAWYQLSEDQPVTLFRHETVLVEERLDGTVRFRLRGKYLLSTRLPERPGRRSLKEPSPVLTKRASFAPAADHPWRKFDFAHH